MIGRVPRRCTAAEKLALLKLIDRAVAGGWSQRRACAYLQIDQRRAWRWQCRRDAGCLHDRSSGGGAVHGLLPGEVQAIVELFIDERIS